MFDVLIRGGRVIDGSGGPSFEADVGIAGARIAEIGSLRGRSAGRTLDAAGLVVCPGFIDMHTHSDVQLLVHPEHDCKVRQGVTLDVIGQDGLGYAPSTPAVMEQLRRQLAGWNDDPAGFDWNFWAGGQDLAGFHERGAINVAYPAPPGPVRILAAGVGDRAPRQWAPRRGKRSRAARMGR